MSKTSEDVLDQPRGEFCGLCQAQHPPCESYDNYTDDELDLIDELLFDDLDVDLEEDDEYELDVDPWEDYE
jgi:hypothetical protein